MIVTAVGYALAGLIAVAIIAIGIRFLVAPGVAAGGYGVPAETGRPDVDAYLEVKGLRDILSGLVVVILMVAGATHLLAWVILGATLIPVGDAVIVWRHGGPRSIALGVHGGTAIVMVVTCALLAVG
ncbi:DUF4267 domain-containing protein [Gordonia sp. GONU]|uniref:DUF4267 domain-containing protein n=1 Tax=Gordonia sp. GONU TaxID=2972949 RepID=UPI0021ABB669|nr:DUF4267 domain-containing protein [Gordonia sp. GONU]MCR8897092.1 DUF4267 domain-containing protein [Gordonia sp. GONU]